MNFIQKYIGLPYEKMDCWQLVMAVYAELGIVLPEVAFCPTLLGYARIIKQQMACPQWQELERPIAPCIAAMSRDGVEYHHVGFYTGHGILHSISPHGVIHQPVRRALWGNTVKVRYYKWVG